MTDETPNPVASAEAGSPAPAPSIAEAIERGLTGANFDLDENLQRGDTRVVDPAVLVMEQIMKDQGVDFDEARLIYNRQKMVEAGIDPDTGLSLDEKAVHSVEAFNDVFDGGESPGQRALLVNFVLMALCFSVNHGCAGAVIVLTTANLGTGLGSNSLALLYFMYISTAMLFSTAIIQTVGKKWGLVLGTSGYCVYVCAYMIALSISPACDGMIELDCAATGGQCAWKAAAAKCGVREMTSLVKAIALFGSGVGGVAAGFLWTAQGGYFARNAELYARSSGKEAASGLLASVLGKKVTKEEATGFLSSVFAVMYLGFDVLMKVFSSIFSKGALFWIYLVSSFASAFAMTNIMPLAADQAPEKKPLLAKLGAAASLALSDPKVPLIAPTEMVFGLSAAMMNAWVNGVIVSKVWGHTNNIGILTSTTAIVAAGASAVAGWYTSHAPGLGFYGKDAAMYFGNAMFLLLGLIVLLNSPKGLATWPMLALLYTLQGLGRGIFESTNKGVIADYFPGPKVEAGFANFVIQSGSASFLMFFFLNPVIKSEGCCSDACHAFAAGTNCTTARDEVGQAWADVAGCAACVADGHTWQHTFDAEGKNVFSGICATFGVLALGTFAMSSRMHKRAVNAGSEGLIASPA